MYLPMPLAITQPRKCLSAALKRALIRTFTEVASFVTLLCYFPRKLLAAQAALESILPGPGSQSLKYRWSFTQMRMILSHVPFPVFFVGEAKRCQVTLRWTLVWPVVAAVVSFASVFLFVAYVKEFT
jgi:hypothetical protein